CLLPCLLVHATFRENLINALHHDLVRRLSLLAHHPRIEIFTTQSVDASQPIRLQTSISNPLSDSTRVHARSFRRPRDREPLRGPRQRLRLARTLQRREFLTYNPSHNVLQIALQRRRWRRHAARRFDRHGLRLGVELASVLSSHLSRKQLQPGADVVRL